MDDQTISKKHKADGTLANEMDTDDHTSSPARKHHSRNQGVALRILRDVHKLEYVQFVNGCRYHGCDVTEARAKCISRIEHPPYDADMESEAQLCRTAANNDWVSVLATVLNLQADVQTPRKVSRKLAFRRTRGGEGPHA